MTWNASILIDARIIYREESHANMWIQPVAHISAYYSNKPVFTIIPSSDHHDAAELVSGDVSFSVSAALSRTKPMGVLYAQDAGIKVRICYHMVVKCQ